jgi:hypothetical protein
MSRRLATVLRVAALQERVARAEAGRAQVVLAGAAATHAARLATVAAGRLPTGGPAALQHALVLGGLRAEAVGVAAAELGTAGQQRAAALARWTAARGRARLLEELDARQRADDDATETRAAQRLADDLSAGRRQTGGRR